MTRLILPVLVLNSPLAKQGTINFCSPQSKHISNCTAKSHGLSEPSFKHLMMRRPPGNASATKRVPCHHTISTMDNVCLIIVLHSSSPTDSIHLTHLSRLPQLGLPRSSFTLCWIPTCLLLLLPSRILDIHTFSPLYFGCTGTIVIEQVCLPGNSAEGG